MVYSIRLKHPVTELYMEIIEKGFEAAGYPVEPIKDNEKVGNRDDIFIVGTIQDAARLWMQNKKRYVLWIQGLWAEESFMRHKNPLRKKCIERLERFFMNRAAMIFFVSEEMQRFYEKKYKISFQNRAIVMPCFNEQIDQTAFFETGKYENNTFTYIGGLQPWQCFDDIVKLYAFFEGSGLENTKLEVYTKEKDQAERIIKAAAIHHYSVDWVPQDQVKCVLRKAKYGFIIREDIDINRVATPTKTVNYLAAGVIPIYSECICGVHEALNECKYAVSVANEDTPEDILNHLPSRCTANEVYAEYADIFNRKYKVEKYVDEICKYVYQIFR